MLFLALLAQSDWSHGADKNKARTPSIQTLLYLAGTEPPPFTYRYRLQAAQALEARGQLWQARRVLEDIVADKLADAEYRVYVPLYAQLLLATRSEQQARELLYQDRMSRLLSRLPAEIRLQIYLMRIHTQLRNNRPMVAFQESVRVSPLLTEDALRTANNRIIWDILMNVPIAELARDERQSLDSTTRIATGWLELARLCRDYEASAEARHEAMLEWLNNWQAHPAAGDLPSDADLLSRPPGELPRKITLMLPLSGPLISVGQAVRDGFLSAWYRSMQRGDAVPAIEVVDTGRADLAELYRRAINKGSNMVIGPLTRENVNALRRVRITVPVLSLNYLPQNRKHNRVYQFGLHPEDELEQLNSYGVQKRWRNLLVLRPKSERSEQYAQSFANLWLEPGGHDLNEYVYLNERDISVVIEQALHLDQSESRKRALEQILGTNLASATRRRQDLDGVIFLGNAQEARLLAPVLRFHRGGGIPLIGTSRAYDGSSKNTDRDDLDAIVFTESPWLLDPRQLNQSLIEDHQSFTRMYGLGVDAWHILPWLNELNRDSDLHFYAASGRLSMERGRIKRNLLWATVEDGELKQTLGGGVLAQLSQLPLPDTLVADR